MATVPGTAAPEPSRSLSSSGDAPVVGEAQQTPTAPAAQHEAPPGPPGPPGPPPQPPAVANYAFSSQLDMASSQTSFGHQGPYDMASMAATLPGVAAYRPGHYPQGGQRYIPATSPPVVPPMPHMAPYGGPPPVPMSQGYYVSQPHMPQYYAAGHMSPPQGPPAARQGLAYYPGQMMMNHPQSTFYYPQAGHYPGQPQHMPPGVVSGHFVASNPPNPDARKARSAADSSAMPVQAHKPVQDESGSRQNAVRGPPRKPRQSGHAIWIGNLPPQTDLMSLVHHVCKETAGLESLFLISKSNCAFANFKDENTCLAAQQKLHDSKFQSVRLVSRLRKNTVEGATGLTAPTGPAANSVNTTVQNEPSQDSPDNRSPGSDVRSPSPPVSQPVKPKMSSGGDGNTQNDKFFILKSLTMEDLELSVRTGIWATQSHNEDSLNTAFKNFDNVYLIFSANKSGEYFGYARMVSEINDDPAAAIEFAPKSQSTSSLDLPKAIPTDATEFAPKGRIIDDSARGTIFWEAERDDSESGSDNVSEVSSNRSTGTEEETKTWGKPFKLEWLSISRLPFYRTRGLRNPWNSNREVKIARDGTELEPSVGRRLIGLFNRVQSPGPMPPAMRLPPTMMHGYVPIRGHGQ
ncbi:YTH domain protein [Ophiocordyceps camponoti-floridani]|uniref:YTH domain protein n=1 Tax=Ophiocordyceps camponoti-floridani TaxID=2030778 RepID=A0A8H4Q174_9HYPO|nr:YTH domain protein [Ophiocordyceps camponoti-floridani]